MSYTTPRRRPLKHLFATLGLLPLIPTALAPQQRPELDSQTPVTLSVTVQPGVDLAVIDWGGEGAPLLFVPSWGATAHVFDGFASRFADTNRVLVMNKRGHGASSRPDYGYTIERLTRDILVVFDSLAIERGTLLALSRSASLVTQFAARYPERVAKLVYLSGPTDRAHQRQVNSRASIPRRLREMVRELGTDCPQRPMIARPPGSFDSSADTLGVVWRQQDPAPPYQRVRAPALAFWAKEDIRESLTTRCGGAPEAGWTPEVLERYRPIWDEVSARLLHDITLFRNEMEGTAIEIPGADYYTYLTHPELVEREIRSFLGSR
jgi:pimeloyl-ACP methyl ester carboxylesterase